MIILQRSIPRYLYLSRMAGGINNSNNLRYISTDENDIIFEDFNDKGLITLNRPKALNSLNLSMVNKLKPVLSKWEKEKTIVVIKGVGEKAFCAGGDVKAVVESGLKGGKLGHEFFKQEYIVNGIIGTYKVPYVALIDGIVMGGGVGLSVHGQFRVATERTLFAMPETAIGLFPDVGGSYFLPKLGGKLGIYLALTGHRLRGADVHKAGIATHFCPSNKLNELESALLNKDDNQTVVNVLNKFHTQDDNQFSLKPHLEKINSCFAPKTMEGILKELEKDNSDWAKKTLQTLSAMSPISLKLTLKELNIGEHMGLLDCLQMEYRLAVRCLTNSDFFEGVRALLIDKDQKPSWKHKMLSDVSDKTIDSFFKQLPETEELRHKL